jgi:hypothetical protein
MNEKSKSQKIFLVVSLLSIISTALIYINVYVRHDYYPIFTDANQIQFAKEQNFGFLAKYL